MLAQGKLAAALSEMRQAYDDSSREFDLAMVYHAMRRRVDSDAAVAQLTQEHAQDHADLVAGVYAYRQDLDKAFMWLERAQRALVRSRGGRLATEITNYEQVRKVIPLIGSYCCLQRT